jgi:hypothetical protein
MNHNMTPTHPNNKIFHITLWVAQILLAALLIMGVIMKFLPITQIAAMIPWTGQIPPIEVRLLGIIDLLGALGLLLPAWFRIKPQLTPCAATGIIMLMISAIIFHVSRGEASLIGINLFSIIIAAFIAWGRWKKAPVLPK